MNFEEELIKLREEGNLRQIPEHLPAGILDFTSNDYLGLASNYEFARDYLSNISSPIFSSSASRLLASKQNDYNRLEELLEDNYGRPCLLFNSGYHANSGIVPALCQEGKTLILADRLVHASIIDGIVLSRSDFKRFPHNDLKSAKRIIEKNYKNYQKIIVITEGVYSMDGDSPDLEGLLNLKKEFPNILLYLDEAHSFGVKGPKGLGLAQTTSNPDLWDVIVCPLGKAGASMGAFVITDGIMKQYLINKCRTLIFSTALPPIQIKWSEYIIKKILKSDETRKHLDQLSRKLNHTLLKYSSSFKSNVSHIQPLIIGETLKTLEISRQLKLRGINVLPIRKPTVPPGSERLRFSLSASMKLENIDYLDQALNSLCKENIL